MDLAFGFGISFGFRHSGFVIIRKKNTERFFPSGALNSKKRILF